MLSDRVIFCDGEALILDKPAGLAVDPPKNGGLSLENYLASLTFGFERWPTAVHRLDRDTSGCLLLARNPKAHKRFAAAFEARQVVKGYVAVLEGIPTEVKGVIDLPLMKVSSAEEGWRMVTDPSGKAALTSWEKLAEKDGRSFIRFFPETGRTHQIRAHALYGLGIGIVGDPVYGSGRGKGPMLLHSHFLSLSRQGKPPAEATAPLPERFIAAGFGPELLAGSDV